MNENYDPQDERETGAPQEGQNVPQPDGGKGNDDTQKKVIYILSYLFGILFFLPLILYPNDAEARFHANQALVILLCAVIGEVVFGILCLIPFVARGAHRLHLLHRRRRKRGALGIARHRQVPSDPLKQQC